MRAILLATAVILCCYTAAAQAQSGWARSIHTYGDAAKSDLPKINEPQPEWEKVMDLQPTDGTATVPSCDDLNVIATVRDGILEVFNRLFRGVSSSGGFGQMFNKVDMAPVWVHPTITGRNVCNTEINVPEMPMIQTERWRFQTYAADGTAYVFFYDLNADRDFGNGN